MAPATRTPPHAAYAGIMGFFAGGLAAAGALSRLLDRAAGINDFLQAGFARLAETRGQA